MGGEENNEGAGSLFLISEEYLVSLGEESIYPRGKGTLT